MDCSPEEVKAYVLYQIGALEGFAGANRMHVSYVKPHGAMYHEILQNEEVARAVIEATATSRGDLCLVTMAGSGTEALGGTASEFGVPLIAEAFPERAYTPQGVLASRRVPGSVIEDPEEVAERAAMMAVEQKVLATDGSEIPIQAQTLCVHGDNPAAVDLVRHIRQSLESQGIRVAPFS